MVSRRTLLVAAALVAVAAGTATTVALLRPDSDVGTAAACPGRDAYCPADGTGVAFPDRPALSPSGRYRLEVRRADPVTAAEDWQWRVLDVHSGAVVLTPPRPAMDGGLGGVVAWAPTAPDTVWTTRPALTRWRPAPDGHWSAATPATGEPTPKSIVDTQASDQT
jgi:hypothetical protein